jgi:NTP pyrophosphatase (non-canonical NTP hydrolase)
MTQFNDYGDEAHKTAIYAKGIGGIMPHVVYASLGLGGEAGEVLEKIKKLYRDQHGELTTESRALIVKELGDALWYLNEISILIGSSLEAVAQSNLQKLHDRAKKGTLQGSGDLR